MTASSGSNQSQSRAKIKNRAKIRHGADSHTMTAFDRLKNLLDLFRHPVGGGSKPKRQVAAVVVRGTGDSLEMLLITSRDTGRWIVPKGWVERGEDGAEAALRETWEEAGLIGEVFSDVPVGYYRYVKHRPRRGNALCEVEVYLVRVIEQKDQWPEKGQRRRKWFPVAAAISLVSEIELKDVIRDALQFHKAA